MPGRHRGEPAVSEVEELVVGGRHRGDPEPPELLEDDDQPTTEIARIVDEPRREPDRLDREVARQHRPMVVPALAGVAVLAVVGGAGWLIVTPTAGSADSVTTGELAVPRVAVPSRSHWRVAPSASFSPAPTPTASATPEPSASVEASAAARGHQLVAPVTSPSSTPVPASPVPTRASIIPAPTRAAAPVAVASPSVPVPRLRVAASGAGAVALRFALAQLGEAYVYGATGPSSWDCSGLTQAAWAAAGVTIPRVAADQSHFGTPVSLSALQPGDLVFYYPANGISHVGMYAGGGRIVNAENPSVGVVMAGMYDMPIAWAMRP